MFFVYKITNLSNHKLYIGKTNNITERWASHINEANLQRKNKPLYNAINKYGIDNFTIEIIENCEEESYCFEREKFWIEFFKTNICKYGNEFGYNLTEGGEGATGYVHTLEQKENKSLCKMGEKNPFYGKTHSQESIDKISKSRLGKTLSIETKEAISAQLKGVPKNENTKRKMSLSAVGKEKTLEHCLNISLSKQGKSNNRPGSKHHNSKLTEKDVLEIRQYFNNINDSSQEKIKSLAEKYSVSESCIKQIVYRIKWKHI